MVSGNLPLTRIKWTIPPHCPWWHPTPWGWSGLTLQRPTLGWTKLQLRGKLISRLRPRQYSGPARTSPEQPSSGPTSPSSPPWTSTPSFLPGPPQRRRNLILIIRETARSPRTVVTGRWRWWVRGWRTLWASRWWRPSPVFRSNKNKQLASEVWEEGGQESGARKEAGEDEDSAWDRIHYMHGYHRPGCQCPPSLPPAVGHCQYFSIEARIWDKLWVSIILAYFRCI